MLLDKVLTHRSSVIGVGDEWPFQDEILINTICSTVPQSTDDAKNKALSAFFGTPVEFKDTAVNPLHGRGPALKTPNSSQKYLEYL